MPNPASVYCEENGNKLEIQTAADGSQSGVCVFPDGSTCDEWAYFRGECGPVTQIDPTPEMTVEVILNASGGYMAPGTSEEICRLVGGHQEYRDPVHNMMIISNGRTSGENFIYFGIDSIGPGQ